MGQRGGTGITLKLGGNHPLRSSGWSTGADVPQSWQHSCFHVGDLTATETRRAAQLEVTLVNVTETPPSHMSPHTLTHTLPCIELLFIGHVEG